MKPLVIIPARGGSIGIPKKNIKYLDGKPLIHYTIEAARDVFQDRNICVSTDCPEIRSIIENTGLHVPFLRPEELATNISSSYEVLLHALNFYRKQMNYIPDVVVFLQATSPFRTSRQIKEALQLFDSTVEMVVSVKETKSNPYYVLYEEDSTGWLKKSKTGNFVRRQDVPTVWEYNGAIYIIDRKALERRSHLKFEKVRKYVMDEASSLDLDTPLDWLLAECMLKK